MAVPVLIEPLPQIPGYTLVKELGSGKHVAVKSSERDGTDRVLKARSEAAILKRLSGHKNIVVRPDLYDCYETPEYFHIVMPLCEGGDLLQRVMNAKYLSEPEAKRLLRQICTGVQYAHRNGVAHRDLKLENILLTKDMNAVIGDWGLATFYTPGEYRREPCGSLHYVLKHGGAASAEVARRDYYVGPEVDCWALGVLLYAMVTGEFPFFSRDPLQLARRIMNAEYTTPDIISPVCADLISRLLVVDVSKRLNIDQVMEHPFVRDEKPTLVRGRSRSHEMLPKLPPQAGADAQVPGATSAVSQVRSQHAPTSASTKSRGGALGFVQKFLSRKVRKTEQSAMKFAEQEQPLTSSLQAVPRSSSGKSSSKKR